MSLMRYRGENPFDEMDRMVRRMRDLMALTETGGEGRVGRMAVNISEDDEHVFIEAVAPGLKPEDVDITVERDLVTIRAEASSEAEHERAGWHVREWQHSALQRRIKLPPEVDADAVSADLTDGILTITLPKTEQQRARKIAVNGA
ncbi:MAG: Hsp20/alpha crystallin family protein [Anaerolineae bacterium]